MNLQQQAADVNKILITNGTSKWIHLAGIGLSRHQRFCNSYVYKYLVLRGVAI